MAIALDATSSSANITGVSSKTLAHTVTGTNPVLLVGITIAHTGGTVTVSSVTYAGINATQVGTSSSGNRRVDLWVLNNPPTGANNIVVTLSGTPDAYFNLGNASYTGARISNQPDVSGTAQATSTTTSKSLTTTLDNDWLVGVACDAATANPVISAGSTFRLQVYNRVDNGYELYLIDTNGAKSPAGSYSIGYTHDSGAWDFVACAISPAQPFTDTEVTSDAITVYSGYTLSTGDTSTSTDTIKKVISSSNTKSSPTWSNQSKS